PKPSRQERSQKSATEYTYPQLPIQILATRPGSLLNWQGGSIFNRRRQASCLKEPLAWIFGIFPVADWKRHIPDVHRNRMQPGEKWKADFGFRRNRPFATDARNLEAVIQRRKSVFPFVGRQSSGRSR
ncbi:MAG TPA: hypothetical protein VIK56_11015, partial [Rhodoferax sp.]